MSDAPDLPEMDSEPRLSKADYEALAAFRFVLRKFLAFSEAAARRGGLTARQYQALLAIKGFPGDRPIRVGELAKLLVVRHHSAVELVDRLVARKLVERRQDAADRRHIQLVIISEGEAILAGLAATHRAELQRVGPAMSALLAELRTGEPPGQSGSRRSRRKEKEAGCVV